MSIEDDLLALIVGWWDEQGRPWKVRNPECWEDLERHGLVELSWDRDAAFVQPTDAGIASVRARRRSNGVARE